MTHTTIHRRHWLGRMGAGLAVISAGSSAWPLAQGSELTGAKPSSVSSIAAHFGKLPAPAQMRRVLAAGPPSGVLLATLAPDKLLGWPM